MIFFDTETCGLHGPTVLLQYAEDDGDIYLHDIWLEPIENTLEIIRWMTSNTICGFNLAFDWFHICQTYTTLMLFLDQSARPIDLIKEYINHEEQGRFGPCCKPYSAIDLMLHARKGAYQSTMPRDDIRIKRIPTLLAYPLVQELNNRIQLNDIYFAKNSDPKQRWKVFDVKNDLGDIDENFKDVVLKFNPSSALKALASDALNIDTEEIKLFRDVELPRKYFPDELGYAPYAKALLGKLKKNGKKYKPWPYYIKYHVDHWQYNSAARQYASDDVKYTREIYKYFNSPEPGDIDSILACMVGAVRWRGFSVSTEKMKTYLEEGETFLKSFEEVVNHNAAHSCRAYLEEVMSDEEKIVIRQSTKKVILEEISKWTIDEVCSDCNGFGCEKCQYDGLIKSDKRHPAAERAQTILDLRRRQKELENYKKILIADRFHVSLKVIGAKSSRMSGDDNLNAQGIKSVDDVRELFTLADENYQLDGGDFDAFEVSLMEAVYADPLLRRELISGKKIHALFGTFLYPGKTYDDIINTKGTDNDLYKDGKQGVFATMYGGDANTLSNRLGVPIEVAVKAYDGLMNKYVVMRDKRKKFADMFCSMRQPNGIGTKVEWNEPADYIESMFGFKRYFTLENKICKILFDLAENPPKEWLKFKFKVVRRAERGEQQACNCVRSALFAAAFGQQAANMRAAGNHVIQSPGATITKMLQEVIWRNQPVGIYDWLVAPFNIHDEVMTVNDPEISNKVKEDVVAFVESMKEKVPLIGMKWKQNLKNWASK